MNGSGGGRWRLVERGVCCVALMCLPAWAANPKSAWDQAVALRAGLDPASTSRARWNRVLDGFRLVYHENPADVHAPDAVNAVAELLAEEGHAAGDQKLLRMAVGQYEFLRSQYPGSRLRAGALLAEGRIEEELGDAAGARKDFAGVVKEAPGSVAAGEARERLEGGLARRGRVGGSGGTGVTGGTGGTGGLVETHVSEARHGAPLVVADGSARNAIGAPAGETGHDVAERLAMVTGIRHWSTATYTRVAIDLGDEVKFEAARVPNPDRIYFDLHGARLGGELVGKSFDVTDDGFLKRIRAAQAGGDVTRVVLDVSDVSDYSAFLLPNPYRLIIDIHGKKRDQAQGARDQPAVMEMVGTPVESGAGRKATLAANASGLPAMSVTEGGDVVRPVQPAGGGEGVRVPAQPIAHSAEDAGRTVHPDSLPLGLRTGAVTRATVARPVPNTVAVRAPETSLEVASVSSAPGRVAATAVPTSRPVVGMVKVASGRGSAAAIHVSDTRHGAPGVLSGTLAEPARAADRTADGETSLVRALGLKIGRIVIDAGHGGHDSGTLGVDGLEEKDVVLDVALRLGKMLHERLGAEIVYTRSDDTFIPLETRTAIANKAQADLFLSIHANSSQDETARGVETYYLNFTSDPTALDVAARENAVGGQGVHQLSDLVKKIALKDKIAESREFAADVEGSLYAGLEKGNAGLKNRGVKKAPFVVLIGANMPSILAEISFVTNAKDAAQLREPEYRQRVAESLYNGVAKYENGLAGARVPVVRAAVK